MADNNILATELKERLQDQIAAVVLENNEVTIEVPARYLIQVCRILRSDPCFGFEMLMDVCGIDYLDYGLSEWETSEIATLEGFSRGVEPLSTHALKDNEIAFSEAKTARLRTDQDGAYPATKRDDKFKNQKFVWDKPRFAAIYHLLSLTHNHRLRIRCFAEGEPPIIPSVVSIWSSANWYEREAFDLFGLFFDGHPDLRRILTDYGFIGHPFRKDFPLIGTVEMRYSAKDKRVIYEPVQIKPRTLVPKTIPLDNRYVGRDNA